ncbi:hypothetical protein Tco_0226757 [Tanacetum coccineum]
MDTAANTVEETLNVVVPKMVNETTDQNMRDNLPMVVSEGIKLEREKTKADIALMVDDAVDAFLRNYMNNNILHVHPIPTTSFEKPASHVDPCRVDAFHKNNHEDHHDDDACPEDGSSMKRQQTSRKGTQEQQEFDAWSDDQGTADDEVPYKEVSPELISKTLRKGMKWVPTTDDKKQMQDALNDMMRSRRDSREEPQYHLDQMKSYMESQIVWESRPEYLTLQILKEPTLVFQSYERDPNAPPIVLVNKDLFYLNNGNSETRKYVLSLGVETSRAELELGSFINIKLELVSSLIF